jgi:polar amino acid transport system substrate-binding protein
MQNGQIVGFDVDLMNALAQQLGTHASLINATFNGIIPGLLSSKYDIGASSFTDTKAREQQVDFVTYFSSGEGFYENGNSTASYNGLSSLCGHKVSVESGTTEETDAKTQAGKCHMTVLSYSDQNQTNLAVSSGRADVGFADSQVAGYIVKQSNGQFKLTGQAFSTAPYGLALPKNSGLAPPILAALEKLMSDGTYTQILNKWGVQSGAITNPQINGATS